MKGGCCEPEDQVPTDENRPGNRVELNRPLCIVTVTGNLRSPRFPHSFRPPLCPISSLVLAAALSAFGFLMRSASASLHCSFALPSSSRCRLCGDFSTSGFLTRSTSGILHRSVALRCGCSSPFMRNHLDFMIPDVIVVDDSLLRFVDAVQF